MGLKKFLHHDMCDILNGEEGKEDNGGRGEENMDSRGKRLGRRSLFVRAGQTDRQFKPVSKEKP